MKMLQKMRTIGYLLAVIFFTGNGINCFQRFSEQPKYTEVNPSQDALLTCKIIDKRGTCSWQKDNKPVGIYLKKYEWAARPSGSSLHMDLQPPPHIGGDCSLWIRSATLDFDDGLWECQVTASDFTTQDALTSQPVRLVVRVAPQRPRLEYEGSHVPPKQNITVDSGALATVKCVSHYGNPPATLKWFLGDQELMPLGPQVNSTEQDNPRTWSASSVVQVSAMRERHGEMLRCVAFHESYTAKSVTVEARMDIKYAPSIRLIGSPEIDLEEDKDALIMRCVADANPPASIVWRRAGRSEIASLQESLQLRPVGRRDAGLYTCQAQNSVGTSEQLSVQLDVKFPPKILSAGPDRLTTAPLFSPAAFECVAEGNPPPSYKWVQRISHGSKYLERGNEARLVIDNVTYDYQGEYECRATSYINGQERTAISEPVSLQVVGAPQVLRLNPSMHSVSVKKGESASLSLVVCADPRPHRVAWEWGSLRLEAGAGVDRFRADDVVQDSREDCYLATLHITKTDEHDSRPYYLVVENERGTDRHAIHLNVEEPLEMSYLMGIAGGCLAAAFILICLCIYAIRGKKCCFKGSSGYKSSDKDSEKADLKSRSDSTSGPQGDSIYTTPAGFQHHQQHPGHHGSPEAMKSDKDIADNNNKTAAASDSKLMVATLTSEESLLKRLSINNPFYRFQKQSHSLKVQRGGELKFDFPKIVRKVKSDSDILRDVGGDEDFLAELVKASGRQVGSSNKFENDSMVITNPFSSILDDRKSKQPSETQTILVRPIKKHRSERSFRRFFDAATLQPKSAKDPKPDGSQHYLCPQPPLAEQELREHPDELDPRKVSVLKHLSMRKAPKPPRDRLNPNLPQLKKLKITYPNRTQSIHSIRAEVKPSSSYFERLQLKTKLGLQRIKEKCRTFKHNSADDCNRDSKDDSFKFISDRSKISNYETKCAKQAIYKSYKSELDLTKNLHYLDAYLQQNYDENLNGYKKASHSVGRVAGSRLLRHKDEAKARAHKRSISCGKVVVPQGSSYETVGTLPIATKTVEEHSGSMSSSDYASVFSEPPGSTPPEIIEPGTRYEHPKISEFFYDNLAAYAAEHDPFFLESQRFYLEDEEEEDERTLQVMVDDFEFPNNLIVDTSSWYQQQNDDRNFLIYDTSYPEGGSSRFYGESGTGKYENYLEHYNRHKKRSADAPEDYRSARTRRNLGGIEYSMSKLKSSEVIDIPAQNRKAEFFTSLEDYGDMNGDSMQLLSKSHPIAPNAPSSSSSSSTHLLSSSLQPQHQLQPQHRYQRQKQQQHHHQHHYAQPSSLSQRTTTSSNTGTTAAVNNQHSSMITNRSTKAPRYSLHSTTTDDDDNMSSIQIGPGFGSSTLATTPQGIPTKSFSSTSASSSTTSSSMGGGGGNSGATIKLPSSLSSLSGGGGGTSATLAPNSASNRYILENIRKYYQHQQPPSSLNSSTTNSSSSSSTASSSVSQQKILALQHQQQQQHHHHQQQHHHHQQQLHNQARAKQEPLSSGMWHANSQQHHQTTTTSTTNHFRRSSTASNASSDNFDSFIALRNGGPPGTTAIPPADMGSIKRSYHTSSIQRNGLHGGDLSNSSALTAGNYFIGDAINGGGGGGHREKYISSMGRAYTSSGSKLSPNFKGPRENYILEYEC